MGKKLRAYFIVGILALALMGLAIDFLSFTIPLYGIVKLVVDLYSAFLMLGIGDKIVATGGAIALVFATDWALKQVRKKLSPVSEKLKGFFE
ncbi:MAG: hypothetical protein IJV31_08460 [Clostridia bacterium]|nr:hypothetical protein [Clostridia bacterium]